MRADLASIFAAFSVLFGAPLAVAQVGACCSRSGPCVSNSTAAACAAPHLFIPGGACTSTSCVGVCCSSHSCACSAAYTAEFCELPNAFYFGGSCAPAPFGSCAPTLHSVGRCCNAATGACAITEPLGCPAPHTYSCTETCNYPCGACCNNSTCACFDAPATGCPSGSTYQGVHIVCEPAPCIVACCNSQTFACAASQAVACKDSNEFWTCGACMPGLCASLRQCCNSVNGSCSVSTSPCPVGTFARPGLSSCGPDSSPCGACIDTATGACTMPHPIGGCPSGSSFQSSAANSIRACDCPFTPDPNFPCVAAARGVCCSLANCACSVAPIGGCPAGSLYLAPILSCSPFPCVGLCCAQSGTCTTNVGSQQCAISGGVFYCSGSCSPTPCLGACCTNFSSCACAATSAAACTGAGQSFYPGRTCAPSPCLGYCCDYADLSFRPTTQSNCTGRQPLWDCVNWCVLVIPSSTGTCCALDGACSLTAPSLCGGIWDGFYSCGASACDPIGACCQGATCRIAHTAACGGAFSQGIACSTGTIPCCRADYNHLNGPEVADIFSYLNDWIAGSMLADADGDGTLEVADIFTFINAWFAGC